MFSLEHQVVSAMEPRKLEAVSLLTELGYTQPDATNIASSVKGKKIRLIHGRIFRSLGKRMVESDELTLLHEAYPHILALVCHAMCASIVR